MMGGAASLPPIMCVHAQVNGTRRGSGGRRTGAVPTRGSSGRLSEIIIAGAVAAPRRFQVGSMNSGRTPGAPGRAGPGAIRAEWGGDAVPGGLPEQLFGVLVESGAGQVEQGVGDGPPTRG